MTSALLYDIHGNLPALEAVLEDARGRGAGRFVLGGDYAVFGPWPRETVERLRGLEDATWIRGNVDRWAAAPDEAPDHPMPRSALAACRDALGESLVAELGALPEQVVIDGVRFCHGSPLSDVRSFLPEPGEDELELLDGARERRIVFGHTHLPFRRAARTQGAARPQAATQGATRGEAQAEAQAPAPAPAPAQPAPELVNPGSVGIPLDGDTRAAYALLHENGEIEHRRVEYDANASAAALRERYDAPFAEVIARRIESARLEAG